jgi:thioredoxin reductase (NADPH)
MVVPVIIVGSGPAGLTAGIYTSRGKIETLILDGPLPGGQLMMTTAVENWPGEVSILGPDLIINMRNQAIKCGARFEQEVVVGVDFSKKPYALLTQSKKTFYAHSVIIATGATSKRLGCKGEDEYWGKGVAVCATCDAPFYLDKDVVVVGGGNSAIVEADHLLQFVRSLTIIHISDSLTATDPLKERVLQNPKVKIIFNSTVSQINGDGQRVTGVIVKNQINSSIQSLDVSGVFIAIGMHPNSDPFKGQIDVLPNGYIKFCRRSMTCKVGVFIAGDVADEVYRQAVTAAGMGCQAALDCQEYLKKNGLI